MPKPLYRMGDTKAHRYCTLCRKDVKSGAPATGHALWHVTRGEVMQVPGLVTRFEVIDTSKAPQAKPAA